MKNTLRNQQGAATIMFTMFMVIIISLLAVGFATLVRNDQRATLDKTLSNQAQYAAESAINNVSQQIKAGNITTSNTNCDGTPTSYKPDFTTPGATGVQVSCLTWDMNPDALVFNNLDTKPQPAPVEPSTNSAIQSLVITWSPVTSGDTSAYDKNAYTQLALASGYVPVLKLVLADSSLSSGTVTYVIPTTNANIATGSSVASTGSFVYGLCSGAPVSCKAVVNGLPGGPWNQGVRGYLSISALGSVANASITMWTSPNGGGGQAKFASAQATIDATARAQDVTKRLVATVSFTKDTWRPGFAVSADTLCKNYKLDGNTNSQAGPVSATACP